MAKPKQSKIGERLQRVKGSFEAVNEERPRIFEVDIVKLRSNPDQPRKVFDENALRELADSIAQHGLLHPISVSNDPDSQDGYIIVAGERRFRAHQLLGKETIWAIKTKGDPTEIAVIENVQRENLSPLEESGAYANLKGKHGYTDDQVAKIVGKGRSTITNTLQLETLPTRIKEECSTSNIPKSTLLEIVRIKDEEEQLAFWEAVKSSGGMTVRVARTQKKKTVSPRPQKDTAEKALTSGDGFVRQLRRVVESEDKTDPELVQKLHLLRDQISGLLQSLVEKGTVTESDEES